MDIWVREEVVRRFRWPAATARQAFVDRDLWCCDNPRGLDDLPKTERWNGAMRERLFCGLISLAMVPAMACERDQVEGQEKQVAVLDARELLQRISQTGGRVTYHKLRLGKKADRVRLVYIPRSALNAIRPTSLVVFQNLQGIMVINPAKGDQPERALTGCLVDGAEDLSKLEAAYRQAGWITAK